jgi:hypothetical protein
VGATRAITLPHGTFAGGVARREAELRAPIGADEAHLLDETAGMSRAETVSELLERCVLRVGGESTTASTVRSLPVGDREALLLHLRAAAFGDRLACVLDCPDCGERMDLELSVSRFLLAPYADPRERYETTLGKNGDRCHVRFRLPTGLDQEAAAREADVEAGVRSLLDRCIDELSVDDEPIERLPEEAYPELSAAMASLDAQAEISLVLDCPSCGRRFSALLDAASILLAELTGNSDRLWREVHTLALHYHWGEGEILGLDLQRRRRYLDLLATSSGDGWPE